MNLYLTGMIITCQILFSKTAQPVFYGRILSEQDVMNELDAEYFQDVVEGYKNFSLQILLNLPARANVVYSPYGIANILGMLRLGATGNTRSALNQLSLFKDHIFNNKIKHMRSLVFGDSDGQQTGESELLTNTVLFMATQQRELMLNNYLRRAYFYFDAKGKYLDFINNPEHSLRQINEWARNKTRGQVQELFANDELTGDTKIVLANTVYFSGKWAEKFEVVEDGGFFTKDGVVQAPMMKSTMFITRVRTSCTHHRLCARYGVGPDIIELPFGDGKTRMVLISSNQQMGIDELQNSLSDNILKWRSEATETLVTLTIPKFTVEYDIDLKRVLQQLGLKSIFDPVRAEFLAMSRNNVAVSKVLHKATFQFDQNGVTAASASSLSIILRHNDISTHVHINRPFVFLIEDIYTGALLFMGRVMSPTKT